MNGVHGSSSLRGLCRSIGEKLCSEWLLLERLRPFHGFLLCSLVPCDGWIKWEFLRFGIGDSSVDLVGYNCDKSTAFLFL
jgi:hypothetical protein